MSKSDIFAQGVFGFGKNTQTAKKTQNNNDVKNKEGVELIPWESLDSRSTKQIKSVIDEKTIFRRMPRQLTVCDGEIYSFLLEHPDVVVGMWEELGATQIQFREISPNHYKLHEGDGTVVDVEVLFKSKNLCIIYSTGSFVTPLFPKPVNGESVLILNSRFGNDREGRPLVLSKLDVYVKIHNPGAEMLAKLLVPVVGKIADSNFEQSVGFAGNVSEAAENDYEAVQNIAAKLKNVRPEVTYELMAIAERIYDREIERYLAQATTKTTAQEKIRIREKTTVQEPPRELLFPVSVVKNNDSQIYGTEMAAVSEFRILEQDSMPQITNDGRMIGEPAGEPLSVSRTGASISVSESDRRFQNFNTAPIPAISSPSGVIRQ
ncbi:MAG: hypothetical protein FWC50_01725 [Planctomycetaceae bacterium]|nr:hypothetical protein [Planctomycetaceae bacterium]